MPDWMIVLGAAVGTAIILLLGIGHFFDCTLSMLKTYEDMLESACEGIRKAQEREAQLTFPAEQKDDF